MWSSNQDYTPAEWARFQAWLDRVYQDFTKKVSQGRKLPPEKVAQIAKGRIWTGEDAKGLGLVDDLGGMDTALRLCRQAIGASESEPLRLKRFPTPKEPAQLLAEALLGKGPDNSEPQSGALPGATVSLRGLSTLRPLLRALLELNGDENAVLSVPGVSDLR